jgi:Zn finger protein HypA/HybF involved in hydrogenase expression
MKIKCERCGKEMEKRGNRVLCIKCTNQRNKEVAKIYRDGYREMKKEAGL